MKINAMTEQELIEHARRGGDFLTMDKDEDIPMHKFVGDVRDDGSHTIRDHVLCYYGTNQDGYGYFHVTTINEEVSCKRCLEIIHS